MSTTDRATRALDQIANSASSAVFTFGAVLLLSARDFGAVSLQLIAMSLTLGLTRAAVFEAALFTRAGQRPSNFSWLMLWCGAAVGLLTAAAMAVVGLLTGGMPVTTTVAVACVGLATLGVDGVRYSAITSDESRTALVTDVAWLVGTICWVIAVTIANGEVSFDALAFGYAAAGAVSGLLGAFRLIAPLASLQRAPLSALRQQSRFGADFALQILPAQFVLIIAPAVIGLSGLGIYRAVVTLYQPLITASSAVRLAVLGSNEDGNALESTLTRVVAVLTAVSCAYAGLALLATHVTGWLDRGALTDAGVMLIALYGAAEVARVGLQPLLDIARLRNRLRVLITVRSVQAVVLVAGSITLGSMLDVEGYAITRLATYAVAIGWMSQLKSPRAKHAPPTS